MDVEAKLSRNAFNLDRTPHIVVNDAICSGCANRVCLRVCPADLYKLDGQRMVVNWEGCLECGTCMACCDDGALSWEYPRGGFGVEYRAS
jgi:ferredoxin like protein